MVKKKKGTMEKKRILHRVWSQEDKRRYDVPKMSFKKQSSKKGFRMCDL